MQGIYNEFLLVGFSVALGCAFIFLRLENPDDDVDKQIDVLNQNELHKYLEDVNNTGAAAYCIAFGLSEVHFLRDTFGSENIKELLRYYMTEAKKRGKQYVLHITKEEIEEKVKQEEAEKSLRWALENDKLEVYFQPIYSIVDRKYTSAEVLVRLWDQNGKMMFPDIFIPIAEKMV